MYHVFVAALQHVKFHFYCYYYEVPHLLNILSWGFAKSAVCECRQQQIFKIVNMCQLTRFEGGLQQLSKAEDSVHTTGWGLQTLVVGLSHGVIAFLLNV